MSPPSRSFPQTVEGRTRAFLPFLAALLILAAWWLSLIVMFDTPVMNVTPPKLVALAVIPALVAARSWRLIEKADLPLIFLLGGYALWLVASAVMRGSAADAKLAGGYALFFGSAAALSYAAARARPGVAARTLIAVLVVGLVVTLLGAALERFTYAGPGGEDPLAFLWEFVRPQTGLAADPQSSAGRQPLHFPSGNLSIPRVASFFAHANYLAFFAFLAAGLFATLLLVTTRRKSRFPIVLAACGLVGSTLISAWTYSRAGLIGILGAVVAAALMDRVATRAQQRGRTSLALRAAPLALVVATLGVVLLFDEVGLRRFVAVVPDASLVSDAPDVGDTSDERSIEASAARSSDLRIALQIAALQMVVATPVDTAIGPGMAAFGANVHDPSSPHYVSGSEGIVDPNSLWLTSALAGGVLGLVALAGLILGTEIRLVRALRSNRDGPIAWTVRWLAAWLPVWALIQFVGTNPFNPSEAMILGTLLGMAIGVSRPVPESDEGGVAGG